MRVPEADMAVGRASPCRQETALVRTPADCFHSCRVLAELLLGLLRVKGPNEKLVVVSS